MSLLGKLVALANAPGTPAEGDTARRKAEAEAKRRGKVVVELWDGTLLVTDEFHAELHRRLAEINTKRPPRAHL